MISTKLKLGFSSFVLLSAAACAEQPAPETAPPPQPELQVADQSGGEVAPPPNSPEPGQAPAAPPGAPPPPPTGQPPAGQAPNATPPGPPPAAPPAAAAQAPVEPAPVEPAPAAGGQWIYTNQYGWLWTPYARDYTYVSPDGGVAYEYAYYPNYGWRWVSSPWVLGWGPRPYWGRFGPRYYAWHSRPWFRVGVGIGVRRGPVYRGRRYRR